MPSNIGPFMVGENLTSASVELAEVNGLGVWTIEDVIDLAAVIVRLNQVHRRELRDIRPLNEPRFNNVPIGRGHSMQIIALKDSSQANPLYEIWNDAPPKTHARVLWTEGQDQITFHGVIGDVESGFDDHGESVIIFNLEPVALAAGEQQVTRL